MDEVDGAHSGENICKAFLHIANDYEIRHKLGYFMMDNASNNDTFMDFISKEQHNLGLEYDPEERQLCCNGHVINLSVQSFLFGDSENALQDTGVNPATIEMEMDEWRKLGPLGKAHNIAVYSRLNPQRIKRFRELSGGLLIQRDNSTRWNSWADMLESLLWPEIKHIIDDYIDENPGLEEERLTKTDWKLLDKVQKILEAFRHATKTTEGANATLSKVLPSIDYLLDVYQKALGENKNDLILTSMVRVGWEKLDKYYKASKRTPVYLAAVVLNSRLKWRYFGVRWKAQWVRDGKRRLREYWVTYKEKVIIVPTLESQDLDEDENNPFTTWLDLDGTTKKQSLTTLTGTAQIPNLKNQSKTHFSKYLFNSQISHKLN